MMSFAFRAQVQSPERPVRAQLRRRQTRGNCSMLAPFTARCSCEGMLNRRPGKLSLPASVQPGAPGSGRRCSHHVNQR
jgi:hypothetical protein